MAQGPGPPEVTGALIPALPDQDWIETSPSGRSRRLAGGKGGLRGYPVQPPTSAEPLEINDFKYSTKSLFSPSVSLRWNRWL
jgi:hypothetical protein